MYSTHTTYTYDEYKKLHEVASHSQLRQLKILIFLLALTMGVFSFFATHSFYGPVLVLIVFALLFLSWRFIIDNAVKKVWNSDKSMQNSSVQMVFDETGWCSTSERGSHTYKYDDVIKVVETKTNFYIFTAVNVATIIVKDNCSEELIDFIRKIKK